MPPVESKNGDAESQGLADSGRVETNDVDDDFNSDNTNDNTNDITNDNAIDNTIDNTDEIPVEKGQNKNISGNHKNKDSNIASSLSVSNLANSRINSVSNVNLAGNGKNKEKIQSVNIDIDPKEILHASQWTSPENMNGQPKHRQSENLVKQIETFEKLISYVESRYSTRKMYQMLRSITRVSPELRSGIFSRGAARKDLIVSLKQLRGLIRNIEVGKKVGLLKQEKEKIVEFFNTFFESLSFFVDMKKFFDETIYSILYDFYYDSSFDMELPNKLVMSGAADSREIVQTMRKLYDLNRRWDSLMTEEELDTSEFEKESKNIVLQYAYYIHVEPILRLVPDLMVKSRKSAELARTWWTESCRFQENLKGNIKLVKQYLAEMDQLTESVNTKSREIFQKDEELKKVRLEMEILEDTEVTVKRVVQEYQDLSKKEEAALRKHHDAVLNRENCMEEIVKDATSTKAGAQAKVQTLKDRQSAVVMTLQQLGDVKSSEQQFLTLVEEVNTKMSSAPHVENPKSEVKKRMTDLRNEIAKLTTERREAERKMALLGSNYAVNGGGGLMPGGGGGVGGGGIIGGGVGGGMPQVNAGFRRFRPGSNLVNALSAAQAMSQSTSYDWASPYGMGGGNGFGGGIEEEEDRLLANLSSAAGLRGGGGGGGLGLRPLPPPHNARARLMQTQETLELLSAKYSSSEEPYSVEGSLAAFEDAENRGQIGILRMKSEDDENVKGNEDGDVKNSENDGDNDDADSIDGSRSEKADEGGEKEGGRGGGGGGAQRRVIQNGQAVGGGGIKGGGRDPLPPIEKPPWKLAYKQQ